MPFFLLSSASANFLSSKESSANLSIIVMVPLLMLIKPSLLSPFYLPA